MKQNETQKKELTQAQQKAVAALLQAPNVKEAAALAAVSRGTLYRWMADPNFATALKAAESEALAALSRRLVVMGDAAAAALGDALAPERDIRDRLRAAQIVLDNLLKLKELLDFEQRLAALEQEQQ